MERLLGTAIGHSEGGEKTETDLMTMVDAEDDAAVESEDDESISDLKREARDEDTSHMRKDTNYIDAEEATGCDKMLVPLEEAGSPSLNLSMSLKYTSPQASEVAGDMVNGSELPVVVLTF